MRPEALSEVDTPADLNSAPSLGSGLPESKTPEAPVLPCDGGPPGNGTLRTLRRIVIVLTGFVVLLVGVAMLVLPGPAIVVIPAGLAILATEFLWARRILQRMKGYINRCRQPGC